MQGTHSRARADDAHPSGRHPVTAIIEHGLPFEILSLKCYLISLVYGDRSVSIDRRSGWMCHYRMMASESTLRFGAQTDEVTSLLRVVNLVRTGEATTRPEIS